MQPPKHGIVAEEGRRSILPYVLMGTAAVGIAAYMAVRALTGGGQATVPSYPDRPPAAATATATPMPKGYVQSDDGLATVECGKPLLYLGGNCTQEELERFLKETYQRAQSEGTKITAFIGPKLIPNDPPEGLKGVRYRFDPTEKELYRFVESPEGKVRIEGPMTLIAKQMGDYLERAKDANLFVADFFEGEDMLPILVSISPDGTMYNATYTGPAVANGWRPDFFPDDIDWFDRNTDHVRIVHRIAHEWVNIYLPPKSSTNEFLPYYLGNVAVFKNLGQKKEDFKLRNCKPCNRHASYFDPEGNLTSAALDVMTLNSILSSDDLGFGLQLKLEEQHNLGYSQIKQRAKVLSKKVKQLGSPYQLGVEDYLEAKSESKAQPTSRIYQSQQTSFANKQKSKFVAQVRNRRPLAINGRRI